LPWPAKCDICSLMTPVSERIDTGVNIKTGAKSAAIEQAHLRDHGGKR